MAEGEKDYIESIEDAQSHYTLSGAGASAAEHIRRALQPQPAPGKDIDTGDGLLTDALGSYDASTFDPLHISPQNCPAFRVWRECKGAIFTLHHFSKVCSLIIFSSYLNDLSGIEVLLYFH